MTKKLIFTAIICAIVVGAFSVSVSHASACTSGCYSSGNHYGYTTTNCTCTHPAPTPTPIPVPVTPAPPVYNPPVYNPPVYNPPVYNPPVYNPPVYNIPAPIVYQQPIVYQAPIVQSYAPLSVTCQANPVNAPIGTTVTWTAIISGGNNYNNYNSYGYNNNPYLSYNSYNNSYNGGYSLSWTGTDGLANNGSTIISKTYVTPGQKVATVTVYQSGQSVTASCASFIGSAAPVISYGAPTQRVYLNQVPYTGAGSTTKVAIFLAVLAAWSALVAYVIWKRRTAATSTTARLAAAGINTPAPVAENSGNFLNNYVAKLRGQANQ